MQNKEEKENQNLPNDLNPKFIFSGTKSELLSDILNEKIDILELAKKELQSRGLDKIGEWCKFGHEIKLKGPPSKSKFYNYFDKIVIETTDSCYVCDENIVEKYPDLNTYIIKDESKCEFLIYGNFPTTLN